MSRRKDVTRDRRKRPRKNTPHYLVVVDAEREVPLGRLVDITCDGLMLVSDEFIPYKRHYRLRLTLPRMVDDQSELTVEAESTWSQRDANPNYYRTGFRFLNLSGRDGSLIEDVMLKFSLVG